MGFPTVTYNFTNGTTADGTQVSQNFTDIINGVSDGTKNISISALTCAGSATLNGSVTLGDSSADLLVITASLNSTVTINTTTSYDIGSTTVGLRALYLGDAGSAARCTKLLGGTIASGWTLTLPTGVPAGAGFVLESTTGGATSWSSRTDLVVVSKTTTFNASRAEDVYLCSDAGASFTGTLPAASGSMKRFVFKKTNSSTNAVTIARAGSDTIDGATSTSLNTQYECVELQSDGSASWSVISRTYPASLGSLAFAVTGVGTITANTFYGTRLGNLMRVIYSFINGTIAPSTLSITLPTGYVIDTAKLSSNTNGTYLGYGTYFDNVGRNVFTSTGFVQFYDGSTSSAIYMTNTAGGTNQQFTKVNGSTLVNTSALMTGDFTIPISGWN